MNYISPISISRLRRRRQRSAEAEEGLYPVDRAGLFPVERQDLADEDGGEDQGEAAEYRRERAARLADPDVEDERRHHERTVADQEPDEERPVMRLRPDMPDQRQDA